MLDNLQQSPTDMYRKSRCIIIINMQKGREATLRGIHAPLGIQLKTVLMLSTYIQRGFSTPFRLFYSQIFFPFFDV